jgi:hypothetical protein
LQISTYCWTPAAFAPVGAADFVVAAGVLDEAVELAAGALVAVAVEPLVVELLLLPQPASNAPHSSATTSGEDRLTVILPP